MSKVVTRSWRVSQQCERQSCLSSTPRNQSISSLHLGRSLHSHSNGPCSRPFVTAQQDHGASPSHQDSRERRRFPRSSQQQTSLLQLPSRFSQAKPFSTTGPARIAGGANRIAHSGNKGKTGKSASLMKAQGMEKILRTGDVPNDLGLLPNTFVHPTGKRQPGWWRAPRDQFQLAKRHLGSLLADFGRTLYFRWFAIKPRPHVSRSKAKNMATELHKEMYQRFAAGNLEPMRSKLCDGLYNNLSGRIRERKSSDPMRWTLHKYVSKPKVVSYKASLLPMSSDPAKQHNIDAKNAYGLVQAVVRLHSLQSLHYVKRIAVQPSARNNGERTREIIVDAASGKEIPPDRMVDRAKEVVEYMVVQQQLLKSELQHWMIWGMTNETTMATLKKEVADQVAAEKMVRKKGGGATAQPS